MNLGNERKMASEIKDLFDVSTDKLEPYDFPVEFRDVYVDFASRTKDGDKTLIHAKMQDRHVAVVDVEREYTFAIVSQDYEIVTNAKAVELAEKCFQAVFKLTDCKQMKLFNVAMPTTRSQCRIDFLHAHSRCHINGRDPWAPFIRVSNSFNRSRALKFDLGFCRGICKNGLIFGEDSIEFKFSHSRGVSDIAAVKFNLKGGEFAKQEARFVEQVNNLSRFHVPRKMMWPLLAKTFGLTPPSEDAKPKTWDNWELQRSHTADLTKKYFDELEDTGYAALNVLTDYASRPPAIAFGQLRVHSLQTTCGIWMKSFTESLKSADFNFKDYLGETYYALVA
jgi:Domain of unknown function (DUF932)